MFAVKNSNFRAKFHRHCRFAVKTRDGSESAGYARAK